MTPKDNIFKKGLASVGSFKFNQEVADVFDDMAIRSIPGYQELQDLVARLALKFYIPGTILYDLGCSTGNTILKIFDVLEETSSEIIPKIVGVDKSEEMISMAQNKCFFPSVSLRSGDLQSFILEKSSVIIASYVLQFMSPKERKKIISEIYKKLMGKGIFILSEKTISVNGKVEAEIKNLYHKFKLANKYNPFEIEQKEKALKKILRPFSISQYQNLLFEVGFKKVDLIFKNLNFSCLVALK